MNMNSKRVKKSVNSSLVLVNGSDALTVEGMERIFNALTGKDYTPEDRLRCQKKIDASKNHSTATGTGTGTEKGK